jgi:hypothetical protein
MRKSERIRLLEMQLVRLQYEIESLHQIMGVLLNEHMSPKPDLDAGKWYHRRPE